MELEEEGLFEEEKGFSFSASNSLCSSEAGLPVQDLLLTSEELMSCNASEMSLRMSTLSLEVLITESLPVLETSSSPSISTFIWNEN